MEEAAADRTAAASYYGCLPGKIIMRECTPGMAGQVVIAVCTCIASFLNRCLTRLSFSLIGTVSLSVPIHDGCRHSHSVQRRARQCACA